MSARHGIIVFFFTSCSFSCSTRTMSPGSTPGAWSASPENVIFCPCLIPLSTWTSRSFVSLHTLWPSHFLQRSFSLITSPAQKTQVGHYEFVLVHMWTSVGLLPSPLQSVQTDCICWTIPGASCLTMILMPLPLHATHFCTAPALPPWLHGKTVKHQHSWVQWDVEIYDFNN